jgi:hypothetical protein
MKKKKPSPRPFRCCNKMLIQEELQQEEDIGTEPAGAAKMTKDNLLQQDDDAKELQEEDDTRELAAR